MRPIVFLLIAAVFSTMGNLLLKQSRIDASPDLSILEKYLNIWFLAAIVLYMLNLAAFSFALDEIPVSRAYPFLAGVGFILLAISGSLIFGEQVGIVQVAGILLIVAGLIASASTEARYETAVWPSQCSPC